MANTADRDLQAQAIRRVNEFATAENFDTRLNRDVRTRFEHLHNAWRLFQAAHLALMKTEENEEQRATHTALYVEIENDFLNADAIVQERISLIERPGDAQADDHSESENETEAHDDHQNQRQLPVTQNDSVNQGNVATTPVQVGQYLANLQFPWQFRIDNIWGEFNGDKKKWQSFHDSFKAAVYDRQDMPAVQKFQILRAALKGNASKSLGEWQVCDRNFEPAWARLKKLYDDQYATSKQLLDKLYGIKKMEGPSGLRLQIISNVAQEVSRQLAALGHEVEHFDLVFVHTIQGKLDHNTSMAWDVRRGDNVRPTLTELTDFLDARARALGHSHEAESSSQAPKINDRKRPPSGKNYQSDNKRSKPGSTNDKQLAVKAENQGCATCTESHITRKCPVFIIVVL